tara:strand:- start:2485 stop:3150 length:666 start_codon:yes stop_codon:yes gene_type:complete
MKKNSLVIGGSSGFGKYLVDYLGKKNHVVHFTGTKNKKKLNYLKFNIFNKKDENKLFKYIKLISNIDYIFYSVGDSDLSDEKIANSQLLKKMLFINLEFPLKLIKNLEKKSKNIKIKLIFFGSDSVFNLKAKPSVIISKAAQIYLVKSHKYYLDKTNLQTCCLILSPLLFKGSFWSNIKKTNKTKFKIKQKLNIFKKPKDYFKKINQIIKDKNINGRIFKI